MLSLIYSFIKKHMVSFILLVVTSTLYFLSSMGIPYIIGKFVDNFTTFTPDLSYKALILAFIVIIFVEILSSFFKSYLSNFVSNELMMDIMEHTLNYAKKLPLSFFRDKDSSYLSKLINNDSWALASFSTDFIVRLPLDIVYLLFIYLYIFSLDLSIGIGLSILIPIYVLIYMFFKKPLYKNMVHKSEKLSKYFAIFNNQMQNIKLIKLNSWFNILSKELHLIHKDTLKFTMKATKTELAFYNTDLVLKRIATLFMLIYCSSRILNGSISIGDFTIINSFFAIALEHTSSILDISKSYQSTLVSYDRIFNILSTPVEHNGTVYLNSINSITLKNISFSYDNNSSIFNKFNYSFTKGNIYCIKGGNGRGKSTLINILLGVIQTFDGDVFYDNHSIKELDLYKMRETIVGVVEQEPCLLQNTIKNNITYGLNNYSDNDFDKWCSYLGIDKFVQSLENGFDTQISEKSSNLSGGEKQKLVICRNLLKNSNILILDEPNSALDIKTSEELKTILTDIKKDKIILMITHDETLQNIADKTLII